MTVYRFGGKVLKVDGKVATGENCCCDDPPDSVICSEIPPFTDLKVSIAGLLPCGSCQYGLKTIGVLDGFDATVNIGPNGFPIDANPFSGSKRDVPDAWTVEKHNSFGEPDRQYLPCDDPDPCVFLYSANAINVNVFVKCTDELVDGVITGVIRVTNISSFMDRGDSTHIGGSASCDGGDVFRNGYLFRYFDPTGVGIKLGDPIPNNQPVTDTQSQCIARDPDVGPFGMWTTGGTAVVTMP